MARYDDSTSYDSDSSCSSDDAPAVYTTRAKKATAVVVDDNSSSYETDSDDDDSESNSKPAVVPVKPTSTTGTTRFTSSSTAKTDDSSDSSSEDSFADEPEVLLSPAEQAKKDRMGEEAYGYMQDRKNEIKYDGKLKRLEVDRKKAERDSKRAEKQAEQDVANQERDSEALKKANQELDKHSTHLVNRSRELVRKSSKDMELLQGVQEALNNDLDSASMHWNKEMEDFDDMRKNLEFKAGSKAEAAEKRATLEQMAYKRKIEVRRERQAENRRRREEEEKAEEEQQRAKEREKKAKAFEAQNSEKARIERAYGWYTKLAFPSREEMRERIAGIGAVDISIDDIDLLPWTASKKRVNVAKVNMILFAR